MNKKQILHLTVAVQLVSLIFCFSAWAGWTEQVGFFSKPPKGVNGIDADNVFVIGGPVTTNATNGGFLDYYDGTGWTSLVSNAPFRFKAVWADNNTVFAVGDKGYAVSIDLDTEDQIDHDTQATEDLRAVWGSSKNDVFAAGNAGVIQHYDGTTWTTMDSGMSDDQIFGIWGTGPDNVYAVTRYSSAILHYDGDNWSTDFIAGESFPSLRAISVTGPNNIFAGGDSGKMIHYDGTEWKEQNTGFTDRVFGLYCAAEDDVFAATEWGKIYRYDGSVWKLVFNTSNMTKVRGIWGSSANDVYAVGDDTTGLSGVLVHYDGDSGTPTTCPFEEAVRSSQDLGMLRKYRDSLATDVKGLLLTKLFYVFAPETAEIMRNNSELKRGLKNLVENNRTLFQGLADIGIAEIDKAQKDELLLYIDDLKQQAGLGLGIVLTAVEYGIRLGWLMDLYRVSVEQSNSEAGMRIAE